MRLTYTTYLDEVQKQPTDQILMVIVRMIFIKLGPLPILRQVDFQQKRHVPVLK